MKPSSLATLAALTLAPGCDGDPVNPAGDYPPVEGRTAFAATTTASVTGSAHLTAFDPALGLPPGLATRTLTLTARRHADGSVRGQWQVVAGASILHGVIDCLTIADDGRSARVSGLVTNTQFALFEPGTAFAMEMFDNGAGGGGEPDVTTQLRAFRNADPVVGRAFCLTGAVPADTDVDPLPTEHGNFVIRS